VAIIKDVDQQKVVEAIVQKYEDWKLARLQKEKVWSDCLNNYLCFVDESRYESWPWRCKAPDTFSQEIGDTIASNLRSGLFPINEDYFKLESLDDASEEFEEDMTEYLKRKVVVSEFTEKIRPFLKQLTVLGNSAAATPWVKKSRPRRLRGQGGKPKKVEEVTYDNFSFDTVDVLDIVLDPGKPYHRDNFKIRRSGTTLLSLQAMKDTYENLSELEDNAPEGAKSAPSDSSEGDKQVRANIFGIQYTPSDEIELLMGYGDIEIDGKLYQDVVIVVANRETLLQFEENPYWGGQPLFFGTYDSLWFTPYGWGPLEPVRGTHELIQTFSCQKADILNLIIMGSFAYVDDGVLDPDSLFMQPGGGIPVGDINNIKSLHPNTNVALTYQEINELRDRGNKSSGASDYAKGGYTGSRKSAYEAGLINQGGSSRFNDCITHTGDHTIEPILNFYLACLQQFKYGSNEVPDAALEARFRVEYFGADMTVIRGQELQQFGQFAEVTGRNPALSRAIDPIEMTEEWRKLLQIKNKKIIKTRAAMAAEDSRMMAMAEAERFMGRTATETPAPGPEQGGESEPENMLQ